MKKIPIKNFNDLVKGKRPGMIENKFVISQSTNDLIDASYILISSDIWTFVKCWYGADYAIEINPMQVLQ
jgi:hypothetical protein